MRPVNRGSCPQNDAGENVKYTDYKNARKALIERMGEYCSYCEARLLSSLAVEHVRPKKINGVTDTQRELSWDNFLLACTNCNSTKGDTNVVIADYLWPDCDNTFSALHYSEGGVVHAAQTSVRQKAQNIISLVGLNKTPDTDNASDRRWLNRLDAWSSAQRAKSRLQQCNMPELREQIVEMVFASGFWSIWMTVFANDQDMLKRLINAMPGTSCDCFDAACIAQARPGGQC